jgi:hypothetical protein
MMLEVVVAEAYLDLDLLDLKGILRVAPKAEALGEQGYLRPPRQGQVTTCSLEVEADRGG